MSRRWYDSGDSGTESHDTGTEIIATLGFLFFVVLVTGVIGSLLRERDSNNYRKLLIHIQSATTK